MSVTCRGDCSPFLSKSNPGPLLYSLVLRDETGQLSMGILFYTLIHTVGQLDKNMAWKILDFRLIQNIKFAAIDFFRENRYSTELISNTFLRIVNKAFLYGIHPNRGPGYRPSRYE